MPQTKLILDSNAYFRLALSIRPLLFVTFGDKNYCLYVIEELEAEFSANPRLRNKFQWIMEKEFRENRGRPIHVTAKQAKEINCYAEAIWELYARAASISKVDAKAIATAGVLKVTLITDDHGAAMVAGELGISAMTSLELVRLMLDCGHISMRKVREIAAYWLCENDRPKRFNEDYRALFNEAPPSEDYAGDDR